MRLGFVTPARVRGVLLVAAFALAGFGVATLRTLYLGTDALAKAEAAFDAGDLDDSIRSARRAAAMSVPGAGHVDAAYARLAVIARGAEAAGKTDVAVAAWDAMRAAALESRQPTSEPRSELERANENLARLRARAAAPRESPEQAAGVERNLLRTLERPVGPGGFETLLVATGFLLGIAGLGWSAVRGISRGGQVFGRELVLGAALFALGVACWTFAVYRA